MLHKQRRLISNKENMMSVMNFCYALFRPVRFVHCVFICIWFPFIRSIKLLTCTCNRCSRTCFLSKKKARSGFGSESKKATCQGALNLWSNLSLIFLQPETSVSGDARSHWHYSPEKLTAWTVKHGALVRNHTERLIAISYQLHQHSLTHLVTLRHSLANPKK